MAGVVGCTATLLGFFGRFFWFFDLFSHFRVQYAVTLTVLGFILLFVKFRQFAGAVLLMATINITALAPMYFEKPEPLINQSDTICAMLINVNSHTGSPFQVLQYVREIDPDILVLEEVSSRWIKTLKMIQKQFPNYRVRYREDNFGIGLFSKLPLEECQIEIIGAAEVPTIVAVVNAPREIRLNLLATHPVPPAGAKYSAWRNLQLQNLPDFVDSSKPTVLLGDLNVTPWSFHFKKLLRETGLIDSARGKGFQPTWPSYNPLLQIPIDHFLHSCSIKIVKRSIGKDVGSDHYPVIVDFCIEE